jgi:hypothetical protein
MLDVLHGGQFMLPGVQAQTMLTNPRVRAGKAAAAAEWLAVQGADIGAMSNAMDVACEWQQRSQSVNAQDGQTPNSGKNRLTAHALTGLQRGLTMYDSACKFGARNS